MWVVTVVPAPAQASAPSVSIVTGVRGTGPTTALVTANVWSGDEATNYRAEYDTAVSEWCRAGGRSHGPPAYETAASPLGFADSTFHGVMVELTELTPGTEYCAVISATNHSGTAHSPTDVLIAGLPSVHQLPNAGGIREGATTATVEGEIEPTGQSTTYHLNYAVDGSEFCEGFNGPFHSTEPVPLGFSDDTFHPVRAKLPGLVPDEGYCADIVAENPSGSADSALSEEQESSVFYELRSTYVQIGTAQAGAKTSNVFWTSATTALVEGEIDPVGQSTSYQVDYAKGFCGPWGPVTTAEPQTPALTLGFTDATFHRVAVALGGLSPETGYCVRFVADNGTGTSASPWIALAPHETPMVRSSPVTTPAAPLSPPRASLVRLKVGATSLALTFRCHASSASGCDLLSQLGTRERMRGKRSVGLSAALRTRTRPVVIAHGRVSVAAGQTKTAILRLNAAGLRLLAHFRHIPARLTTTLTNGADQTTVASETVTVTHSKVRRRR